MKLLLTLLLLIPSLSWGGLYHDPNGIDFDKVLGSFKKSFDNIKDIDFKKEVLLLKLDVKSCDFTSKDFLTQLEEYNLCKNTSDPIFIDFGLKFIKNDSGAVITVIAGPNESVDEMVDFYLSVNKDKPSQEEYKKSQIKRSEKIILASKSINDGAKKIINNFTALLMNELSKINIDNYKEYDFKVIDILGYPNNKNSYNFLATDYCEKNLIYYAVCFKTDKDSIALFPYDRQIGEEFDELYLAKIEKLAELDREKKYKEPPKVVLSDYYPLFRKRYKNKQNEGWCKYHSSNEYFWGNCKDAISTIEKWREEN